VAKCSIHPKPIPLSRVITLWLRCCHLSLRVIFIRFRPKEIPSNKFRSCSINDRTQQVVPSSWWDNDPVQTKFKVLPSLLSIFKARASRRLKSARPSKLPSCQTQTRYWRWQTLSPCRSSNKARKSQYLSLVKHPRQLCMRRWTTISFLRRQHDSSSSSST